jgi:two-component system, LuxR family, response regulator FixJ
MGMADNHLEKPFGQEAFVNVAQSPDPCCRQAVPKDMDVQAIQRRFETLSKREREIAEALVAGKSRSLIATELNLSPRTVEIYRANLLANMGADDLLDLVRMLVLAKRVSARVPH